MIDEKAPVDNELWVSFHDLKSQAKPVYEELRLPADKLEVLKHDFFESGKTINPDLRIINEDAEFPVREAAWLEEKERIRNSMDEDMLLRQAYLWRINEILANQRMVYASARGDMHRFRAYNSYIYGEPNHEIFAGTAEWFRDWARDLANSESRNVREAAEAVLEKVPDLGGQKEALKPSNELFKKIREQHFSPQGYFSLVLEGVQLPQDQKIGPAVGNSVLRQVLTNIGASHVSLVDSEDQSWSAGPNELRSPAGYSMPQRRFLGLVIGHEVRHLLERINGQRQAVRLFGSGLDRYEKGNEGREVVSEQIVFDTFDDFTKQLRWQDLMRRSLAISLGLGIVGAPRDFKEVYSIINAIDRLWERAKSSNDIVKADAKADDRTWKLLTTKTFKGTDGCGGAVYQRDNYLEYNIRIWQVAAVHPELIKLGDLGKFDISNPRHIQLAQAFGVLPIEQEFTNAIQ